MKQLAITALIAVIGGLLSYVMLTAVSKGPKEVDQDQLIRATFVNSHHNSAELIWEEFGIPMSVSIGIAALTTDFGRNEVLVSNNSYFLLEAKGGTDTMAMGETVFIRAFDHQQLAYVDFAKECEARKDFNQVKGKPLAKWADFLNDLGYADIHGFIEYFPELQKLELTYAK